MNYIQIHIIEFVQQQKKQKKLESIYSITYSYLWICKKIKKKNICGGTYMKQMLVGVGPQERNLHTHASTPGLACVHTPTHNKRKERKEKREEHRQDRHKDSIL